MFPTRGLLQHVECPDDLAGRCERFSCPFLHPPRPIQNQKRPHVIEEGEDNTSAFGSARKRGVVAATKSNLTSKAIGQSHNQRSAGVFDNHSRPQTHVNPSSSSSIKTVQHTQGATRGPYSQPLPLATERATGTLASGAPLSTPQGAPSISRGAHPLGSKVPLSVRETSLRTFYAAYSNLYAPLSPKSASGQHAGEIQSVLENAVQELASEHALATEKEVFKASHTNAVTYRNSIRTTLVGIIRRQKEEATSSEIRKLGDNARRHLADLTGDIDGPELKKTTKDILQSSEMIGTPSEVRVKLAALEERAKGRLTIGRIEKHDLIATDAQLILCQYPVPPDFAKSADLAGTMTDAWGSGDEQHSLEGQEVACGRCTTKFIVRPLQEGDADAEACCYHWGRRRFVHDVGRNRGPRTPRWTCCGATDEGATLMSTAQIARDSGMVKETEGAGSVFVDGAAGCIRGPHVFKEEECELLHRREAFKTTTAVLKELSEAQRSANKTERLDVLAFDCELVYTTAGMSLARLTVLDESGKAVLDVYVRPRAAVLDYNTRFSGIRCSNLEGQVSTLPQARQALVQLMRPDSILVGHGLENDLKAVRLVHTRIIDSAILYPHPKGLPFRMSLRELTRIHLGRYIQQDSDEQGHDAEEDARAALELIRRRFAELAASGAKQIEPVTSRPVNPFTRPSAAPPVPPTMPSPATTSSLFLPKAKRR